MDELKEKSNASEYDVVVIGAGPAGTCAALRLLRLGYRVAIIERLDFPRFQIGESLSPGIWNIFQYLEAEHLLTRTEYIRNLAARVIWEQPAEKRMSAAERGPGIIVDRKQLDTELLALCRERGASVFQPATVKKSRFAGNEWNLEIKVKDRQHRIKTFFVFDARGKNGVSVRDKIPISPLSVGIWTHLPARDFPQATLIEAVESGWLWGSPLPNGEFRVLAFVDAASVKNISVSQRLKSLFAESAFFRNSARLKLRNCFACPVQSFWNANGWKENYIHLGESAFAIDPLSSSGVEKAMRFSLQSVVAFNTIMKKGNREIAKNFYTEKLLKAVASHTRWTQEFYSGSYIGNFPFWAARRTSFYAPNWRHTDNEKKFLETVDSLNFNQHIPLSKNISIRKALSTLNQVPLRIARELTYQKTLCVVGDCLEMKLAVKSSVLSPPTAYIGNVKIVRLLQNLESVFTADSVINNWTASFGLSTSARLFVSLWSLGVFEKLDNPGQ